MFAPDNTRIYPDLIQSQLAPSGYVYPLGVIPNVPPSIIHTLVSMLISHRIIQMTPDSASNALVKPLWTRLYRHRNISIRAIAELVGNETTRASFRTIISVYTLLFATVRSVTEAASPSCPKPRHSSNSPSLPVGGPMSALSLAWSASGVPSPR